MSNETAHPNKSTDVASAASTQSGADTPHFDLSTFQLATLRAVARLEQRDELPYGLAIKAGLEQTYGQEINTSRLYPNLNELVEAGLLAKTAEDGRTYSYALTAAGEATLAAGADWLLQALDRWIVVEEIDGKFRPREAAE